MSFSRRYLSLFLLCAFSSVVYSQQDDKAWSLSLDSIVVSGNRYSSPVKTKSDGSIYWDMKMMDDLPKIMGNADPLHYAQMLPGIQTNNEYKSGINIQGCDNSHNFISIQGAPLYNVGHLLGFFSTFNASHYPSLSLSKSATVADAPNRLGGQLTMQLSDSVPETLNGEFTVGLISSQGTVRLPLSRSTALTLSLRGSYLNLLYSRWLQADEQQVKYSFYDANATLVHHVDTRNTLTFDFYSGSDIMSVKESDYYATMKDTWGNHMGALHWRYTDPRGLMMNSSAYVTHYHNRFSMQLQDMSFSLPSSITDIGVNTAVDWRRFSMGADLVWHDIHPQSLASSGSFNLSSGASAVTRSFEGSLHLNYTQPLLPSLYMIGGLRASYYHQPDADFHSLDPSVALRYDDYTWQGSLSLSTRRQYLFQTGFSNIGLPSEFWLSCNDGRPPQHAYEASASLSRYLFHRRYRLTVDAYYKKLYNQVEYSGSVLDYLNSSYDVERSLLYGRGENYGFSVMLHKCSGPLTGWVSYAYAQARRTFSDVRLNGSYPASHERPHELNAVATYSLGRHWSFGATFVYASGTPFTAPRHLAFINGNLMIEYGDHNSNRLKPYHRLDLSVNYKWKSSFAHEQGLNLSVYNVTAHKNELFYYIRNYENGSFAYRPVSFALNILPSISYFCKF